MKILKSITFTLLASTLAYSQTTMCFKENHNSMTTIENTALDGGECKGSQTVSNMKTNGWNVDDIKITTKDGSYNFIYIFKKNQTQSNFAQVNTNVSDAQLEKRILKRMEAKKVQEAKEKEIKRVLENKIAGKELYTSKCQSCHGEKGEVSAYNVAKPLKDLSVDDISFAIGQYTNRSDYGYDYNMVMRPIAANTTKADIVKIKDYLDSVNK
jgi:cytochrome c553